jgi:hypothetical protein
MKDLRVLFSPTYLFVRSQTIVKKSKRENSYRYQFYYSCVAVERFFNMELGAEGRLSHSYFFFDNHFETKETLNRTSTSFFQFSFAQNVLEVPPFERRKVKSFARHNQISKCPAVMFLPPSFLSFISMSHFSFAFPHDCAYLLECDPLRLGLRRVEPS